MRETAGFRWFRRLGLTVLTLLTAAPLYVIVSSSVKPLADVQSAFRWIPSAVTFAPYRDMWTTVALGRYFANSLVVAVSSTVLSLAVAVLAAYALARYRFRGRQLFRLTILATQVVPGTLFLLPLFLVFAQAQTWFGIQLVGSYSGLILTALTFSLPFSVWMLAGYFAGLPREIEEAATVDGLGPVATLFRIVLPIARPAMVAVGVFTFMIAWSEVLFASVLASDRTRTLAVGLQGYASQSSVRWNELMAASVLVSVPILAGFLGVQRHLTRRLAAGAVS